MHLAEFLIRASQYTPFRGAGGYSSGQDNGFPQAETEFARVAEFFQFFHNPPALHGKRVLDFGCGYGGRSVGYATVYGASDVIGVEPFAHVVEKCQAFAQSRGVTNCSFLVNDQHSIPLPAQSIDVAISYDVFEHVTDPSAMLQELHRVLIPGGRAYIVFTPYYGAFSHHLNYITRLPGLHWFFAPEILVSAVNGLLRNGGAERFGTNVQPEAPLSFGGRRRCLPGINGVTGAEFLALVQVFHVVENYSTPLLERFRALGKPGAWLNASVNRAGSRIEEALSFNLVCVLERHHRPT